MLNFLHVLMTLTLSGAALFFFNTLSQCPFFPIIRGSLGENPIVVYIDDSGASDILSHVGWPISVQTIF
jgi:hypothetical protein